MAEAKGGDSSRNNVVVKVRTWQCEPPHSALQRGYLILPLKLISRLIVVCHAIPCVTVMTVRAALISSSQASILGVPHNATAAITVVSCIVRCARYEGAVW